MAAAHMVEQRPSILDVIELKKIVRILLRRSSNESFVFLRILFQSFVFLRVGFLLFLVSVASDFFVPESVPAGVISVLLVKILVFEILVFVL